ncbi:hypothetical protein N657DRAFT_642955 [Parathielavia appendiculata]|uniref:Uncharacterized protein n=1 Tax=Parathielavia appendiculata TaxID=2587402 RepID=A0AAN6Z6B0_9PEZI|nr:hypothetical protein N657DRAFT_642955 [Parathielavia appendiculata]
MRYAGRACLLRFSKATAAKNRRLYQRQMCSFGFDRCGLPRSSVRMMHFTHIRAGFPLSNPQLKPSVSRGFRSSFLVFKFRVAADIQPEHVLHAVYLVGEVSTPLRVRLFNVLQVAPLPNNAAYQQGLGPSLGPRCSLVPEANCRPVRLEGRRCHLESGRRDLLPERGQL